MVERSLVGIKPWRRTNRIRGYPPLEDALQAVGLKAVHNYISRHHNRAMPYIATEPIFGIYLEAGPAGSQAVVVICAA